MQWYYREIDFKNMHAKKIENKKIMNLELEGLRNIYSSRVMSFCREEGLKCDFILVIFWVVFYLK